MLIFLSQLSLSELLCPDLAQVDSSVLQHCTGVLCTVPPPLLAASWPLTETLTLSGRPPLARPHSDPHTQTTTRSHHHPETRQLSNQVTQLVE